MGLAGESLVEARWLQPFSKALLRLKQQHDQLADTVEGLAAAVGQVSYLPAVESQSAQERAAAMLNDARAKLAACRELLSDRMAEFDRRMRNADDLSARSIARSSPAACGPSATAFKACPGWRETWRGNWENACNWRSSAR